MYVLLSSYLSKTNVWGTILMSLLVMWRGGQRDRACVSPGVMKLGDILDPQLARQPKNLGCGESSQACQGQEFPAEISMGNETTRLFPNLPRSALIRSSVDLSEDRFLVTKLLFSGSFISRTHCRTGAFSSASNNFYHFPSQSYLGSPGIETIVHRVIRKRKEKPKKRGNSQGHRG